MSIIHVLILAIMQGLTEFLPVSSSAHLVITSSLYKLACGQELITAGNEEIFTDIVLHLGTLFAVVFFFKKDILQIINAFITACKTKNFDSFEAKLPVYLTVGTIFTIITAYPLNEFCEKMVSSPAIVGFFLIITGFVLFFSEQLSQKIKQQENSNQITLKKSILIGLAQGIAACPGLSRSGMTISAGLLAGLNRITAAKYSFLLSILIILGSSVFYPVLKLKTSEITSFNWISITIGFFVSMIVGYFCVKYFMQFLNKYSMKCFAYYCWVIGVCAIVFFNFVK